MMRKPQQWGERRQEKTNFDVSFQNLIKASFIYSIFVKVRNALLIGILCKVEHVRCCPMELENAWRHRNLSCALEMCKICFMGERGE